MQNKISHYRKANVFIGVVCLIAIIVLSCVLIDKSREYTVPAVVIGTDYDGYTLFETPDGNVWAYELPSHVEKGTNAKLNMYDMSPDGKTVKYNKILSVNVDGVDITTETEELK